jgi:hypothetical protein
MTVLAEKPDIVPVAQLRHRLTAEGLHAIIEEDEEVEDDWEEITLHHRGGEEIAVIYRAPVKPGALGQGIIRDFLEQIEDGRPRRAADWLTDYLPSIKTVYYAHVLSGTDRDHGWDALRALLDELRTTLGGILHAEAEGFSNANGYHILWEFHEGVTGLWQMAVLDENGRWQAFEMELSDPARREAFLNGMVPDGAQRL